MSAHFGRVSFEGRPIDREVFDRVRPWLAPYGPDGENILVKDEIGVLFRAFHTTRESEGEVQPCVSASGLIFTWDGRLDNRQELIRRVGTVSGSSTDLEIAVAAYENWGTASLGMFVGDWALAIWNPRDRSLLLARDPVGVRHLYYSGDNAEVTWCSMLATLIRISDKAFALNEEYVAGWLALFPADHLTPFTGVHAVPASSYVRLTAQGKIVTPYWSFDPGKRIRYRTDTEYEEQFCQVFAESVRRRMRSNGPVLAELSGGMDSSSIVCMADRVAATANVAPSELDTVSYHNNSEPNWNEFPYFTAVERRRGRTGCHIDLSLLKPAKFTLESAHFAVTPALVGRSRDLTQQLSTCLASKKYRVLLSGIGGDEVMGGVPTPLPELANLFAKARLTGLIRQLLGWSLAIRKPAAHLLLDTLRAFLPVSLSHTSKHMQPPIWLYASFVSRRRSALMGYPSRLRLFGPLPSFQEGMATLDLLRRQLSCPPLPSDPPYEQRYPFLDRDLLEFAYAVPRDQLLRPGQRRSLMRRALKGIVPDEILERRRKAFVEREPIARIRTEWAALEESFRDSVADRFRILDSRALLEALQEVKQGIHSSTPQLFRALMLEAWLKNAVKHNAISTAGIFDGSQGNAKSHSANALWHSRCLDRSRLRNLTSERR